MQRRNNGDGCIRQRQDGCWEAKLVIEGKTKSFYGKTKAEVKKKLAQVQADLTKEEYLDETNMTVNQWLDEWLRDRVLLLFRRIISRRHLAEELPAVAPSSRLRLLSVHQYSAY